MKPLTSTELRVLACFGKQAYATATGAHAAMKRMTKRGAWKRFNKGRALTTYRCAHCHQWHLGTTGRGH